MGHFCPYKAEKKFQNSGLQFLLYLSVQYNSHINAFAFIPCGWSGGHLVRRLLRLHNHVLHENATLGAIAQRQSDHFDKHKYTTSGYLPAFPSSPPFWLALLLIQPPWSCAQLRFPHSLYLSDIYDTSWDHWLPEGVIWLTVYGRSVDYDRCVQHKVAFLPGLIYY